MFTLSIILYSRRSDRASAGIMPILKSLATIINFIQIIFRWHPKSRTRQCRFPPRNSTFKFWDESGTGGANDEFIDLGSETIGRGKLLIVDRTFPRYQG
jgi:hypothetical protein